MTRGKPQKKINENFFDKESKAMRYVSGLAYPCYLPQPNYGIIFRSRHKDLVRIIKNQLESGHAIISDTRNNKSSHRLEITNRPYLHSRLQEMGLNVPKKERKFPENINGDYIFVRGFLDGKVGIWIYKNRCYIEIRFNNPFLIGLNQVLAEYAGVQRAEPRGNRIIYAQKDSLKIHDFIYQDIEDGLYLSSKKELFENYLMDRSTNLHTIARSKKINKAQKLLLQGMLHKKIADQLGYSMTGFYVAFRGQTGMTPRQWTRQNS